ITTADTTPTHDPGFTLEIESPTGPEKYKFRYVYNGEASSSFAAKDAIVCKTTATTAKGVSHGAYNRGVGILGSAATQATKVLGVAYYT
ncbi:hypothetical protein, partial [Streptococcus pneumoniae]|uniref:hypothetical protein n=1 Tax=Streptococcus pneumoniae TaxID=1313 RepID=UPI0018B01FE7